MDEISNRKRARQHERQRRRIDLGCHCHAERESKTDAEQEEGIEISSDVICALVIDCVDCVFASMPSSCNNSDDLPANRIARNMNRFVNRSVVKK